MEISRLVDHTADLDYGEDLCESGVSLPFHEAKGSLYIIIVNCLLNE